MANIVLNIAKGRFVELALRVKNNDPANSALVIVPVDVGGTSDATIRDFSTLAAVLGGGVTERSTGGWGRKTLTDADLGAIAPNNTTDTFSVDIPDQTWTSVTTGNVTDLLVCYDSDTTSGTDANVVPCVLLDFSVTPVGADEVAVIDADGIFQAS